MTARKKQKKKKKQERNEVTQNQFLYLKWIRMLKPNLCLLVYTVELTFHSAIKAYITVGFSKIPINDPQTFFYVVGAKQKYA